MNYIISYPPNTKDAEAEKRGNILIVKCPHCGGKHLHMPIDAYRAYIKADCKKGFYVIKVKGGENIK